MPARLKSYSCSNCGGVLNVDRDEDVFDCPFCGARFDVMDFHKRDILDEVHELWERKDFAGAKNKLERTLPKDTDDFELLSAYALSVANLTSFTNLDKPKKINLIQSDKLYELLEKDERYSSGIGAPYFAKLSEMLPIAYEYNTLSGKKFTLTKRADELKAKLDKEKARKMAGIVFRGFLFVLPLIDVFVLLAVVAGPWILWVLLVLLGVIVGGGFFSNYRYKKIEDEYQKNMSQCYELRAKARELTDKMEPLEESYKIAFKELEELRPKPSDIKKVTKEYKLQPDSIVRTAELMNVTCSKCGGAMVLDKSRKLYVCKYCGIAYGYSLFFGDVRQKAYEFLKEGDFAEADKRFLQVLANYPDDLDAIRGRVLCAGGWRAFGEMKVTDKLTEEQMKALRERIDEAKEHFTGTDQFYPGKISLAVNYLKQYGDVPDGNDEEKSAAAEDFNSALRDLIDADREFRTRQINS